MRKLVVPLQVVSQFETVFDRIKLLLEKGAMAVIDQVNWRDLYPGELPVNVRAAHDGEVLYLYYTIKGEAVSAQHRNDFDPVWKDSCVEFFMQRVGDIHYRNFECNILGALLAARHETRESAEQLTEEVTSIFRFATINHHYLEGRELSDWSLYLEIPKKAMGFDTGESLSGHKIRANFYKCGDETPEPHYISWSPINLPNPDFHVPHFFGLLEFA